MKILTTFGGREFILEDDEAENIIIVKNSPTGKAFLELRCGAFVDTSAIESITDIPLIPYSADGYPLSKDGRSFIKEGVRIWIENFDGIKYLPDSKYKRIAEAQFLAISELDKKKLN